MNEKIKDYPKTEMFEVKDTYGVPHPYVLTPRHIAVASARHGSRLTVEAIRDAERTHGNCCGARGCNLKYDDHKVALVVYCKTKDPALMKEYLQSIATKAEADGFVGFVLVDATDKHFNTVEAAKGEQQ